VITVGCSSRLWLLSRVLPGTRVLASCPTYPGLAGAIRGTQARITHVAADAAGEDPNALGRAGRSPGGVAYLMPAGHNPTGAVMPLLRRQALAAIADAGRVTVVEDLTLADLTLGTGHPLPPLAALSTRVIAVGSVAKMLWGGMRVGWIRCASEPLRSAVIARKSALNLGTAAISQSLAAQLLAAIDADWLTAHRAALTERRDLLAALLSKHLPAWRTRQPDAGLSLWAELPVENADAFTLAAARKRLGDELVVAARLLERVEIDGRPAAVLAELEELFALLTEAGANHIERAPDAESCERIWKLRREFSFSLRDTGLTKLNEDIVVPMPKLVELVGFARKLEAETGIPVACFGHAGDGNIHTNIMVDFNRPGAKRKSDAALDELFRQILAWGGAITGEHGIGLAKQRWWPLAVPEEVRALHRSIKQTLDPHSILNPGKFV